MKKKKIMKATRKLHHSGVSSSLVVLIILVIVAAVVASVYALSKTLPAQSSSNVIACGITYYRVYQGLSVSGSSTLGQVTETLSSNTSYTTTTSIAQTVGYVTSTRVNFTGTLTGALAEWNVSACTYTKTNNT